jgi:hypothetical protein
MPWQDRQVSCRESPLAPLLVSSGDTSAVGHLDNRFPVEPELDGRGRRVKFISHGSELVAEHNCEVMAELVVALDKAKHTCSDQRI